MGNQNHGSMRASPEANLKAHDALPVPIRRIYSLAPYDYHMPSVLRDWKRWQTAGGGMAEFRRQAITNICDNIMRDAARCWGKDHPDAMRSRLGGRA